MSNVQNDIGWTGPEKIVLGDPVPWFRARTLSGSTIDLHVSAGRWIVLAFMGSAADQHTQTRLESLRQLASSVSEDQMMIYIVLSDHSHDRDRLLATAGPVLKFIVDYDGAVGKPYGPDRLPKTAILDPMLRVVANISCQEPASHDQLLAGYLRGLPAVDDSAGVPLVAPVLMVPRVLDFALCDHLISLFEKIGGTDSGFLVDRGGQPATVTDHGKKNRRDLIIATPELQQLIREQIVKRLLPAIKLGFQFEATHMDRYVVSRYDSDSGGHFYRHRDNMTPGVEHRRFAVSINLNGGYEGCDLIFPEFGRRSYRAPTGGALVFSCSLLHEVRPITKGKRYVFLPFLYGNDDAEKGAQNAAMLRDIGLPYRADEHRLQ